LNFEFRFLIWESGDEGFDEEAEAEANEDPPARNQLQMLLLARSPDGRSA